MGTFYNNIIFVRPMISNFVFVEHRVSTFVKAQIETNKNKKLTHEQLNNEHDFVMFYFQVRESPAPLNIPTPNPAPDRGGLVACLGGPVANKLSNFQGSDVKRITCPIIAFVSSSI